MNIPWYFEHPTALGSFRSWVRLLSRSGGIDRVYWPRLLAVSLTTLLTSPFRLYERARYGRSVGQISIDPAPVFIVGHWRTGTTHLHNLLSQDSQFGTISTFQAMAPGFALSGESWLKPLLAKQLEKAGRTREIDNIPLSLDAPQEEAFALANMSSCASLHIYSFPRQGARLFEKFVLLRSLSKEERAEWTRSYLALLRKTSFRCGGKRLLLKDPANTGRIAALLELFPQAKFVHISRNPYDVFPSMMRMLRVAISKSQLQQVGEKELEALAVGFYQRLLGKFLEEKPLIPRGSLVEVKYEDLGRAPIEQLRTVYDGLGLRGFEQAEPAFRAYAMAVKDYEKCRYQTDPRIVDLVNRSWAFAFDEWGYPRREEKRAWSSA